MRTNAVGWCIVSLTTLAVQAGVSLGIASVESAHAQTTYDQYEATSYPTTYGIEEYGAAADYQSSPAITNDYEVAQQAQYPQTDVTTEGTADKEATHKLALLQQAQCLRSMYLKPGFSGLLPLLPNDADKAFWASDCNNCFWNIVENYTDGQECPYHAIDTCQHQCLLANAIDTAYQLSVLRSAIAATCVINY